MFCKSMYALGLIRVREHKKKNHTWVFSSQDHTEYMTKHQKFSHAKFTCIHACRHHNMSRDLDILSAFRMYVHHQRIWLSWKPLLVHASGQTHACAAWSGLVERIRTRIEAAVLARFFWSWVSMPSPLLRSDIVNKSGSTEFRSFVPAVRFAGQNERNERRHVDDGTGPDCINQRRALNKHTHTHSHTHTV